MDLANLPPDARFRVIDGPGLPLAGYEPRRRGSATLTSRSMTRSLVFLAVVKNYS